MYIAMSGAKKQENKQKGRRCFASTGHRPICKVNFRTDYPVHISKGTNAAVLN